MIKRVSATMDRSEVITSEGQGVWGARYELRLLTSVCTYSDSSRQTNKALQSYVVEFGPKSQADRRSFKSDEARRLFLEQSFSDLESRYRTSSVLESIPTRRSSRCCTKRSPRPPKTPHFDVVPCAVRLLICIRWEYCL